MEILKGIGIVAVGEILLILSYAKKVGLFSFFARKKDLRVSRTFDSQFAAIFSF